MRTTSRVTAKGRVAVRNGLGFERGDRLHGGRRRCALPTTVCLAIAVATSLLSACTGDSSTTNSSVSRIPSVSPETTADSTVAATTTTSSTTEPEASVALTVPVPRLPVAAWSGSSVPPTPDLGDLPSDWYEYYAKDTGCPLLAPTAAPGDFGANGPPNSPQVGTAGGGPFITWPGDGTPTMYVVPPPLTIGDANLDRFYAASVVPIIYADGSQERLTGDGSTLILLPGIGCGYIVTSPDVHVYTQNFFNSLRIITAPA
jgi:hypothetical protein